jgi:methyl-accepting chemotaxis protein
MFAQHFAEEVSTIVNEIAATSEEQSSGIEQVNRAVVQMDEVTQQNVALVEEAAAVAQSLEEQAAGLRSALSIFSVEGRASTAPSVKTSAVIPRTTPAITRAPNVARKSALTPPRKDKAVDRRGRSETPTLVVAGGKEGAGDWETF